MVLATCDRCGQTFKRVPNRLKNRDKVFCSRACYHAYRREHPAWAAKNLKVRGPDLRTVAWE